ncbi:glycogen/starch/alpha-glucan phosphorylase, partial [Klebsiella pneumoniae]|nr:glycogen/starch/alpha-glucan phosphorylase [Klebsiella pneumoniae]
VNGVAWLHSELVKKQLVPDFYFMTPEKFINQTNGVTPRRWVQQANPGLAEFLQQQLGEGWPTDLPLLSRLEDLASEPAVIERIRAIKFAN